MRQLPSPFTPAERGRYGYRYSVRQLEMSDTAVFDKPAAGRAWFEQTISDQLDLGRPDKVQIIFDRKLTSRTPGRFQTKVITKGVEPVIQAHYKHSKAKQYFKEGRALRTETTVKRPLRLRREPHPDRRHLAATPIDRRSGQRAAARRPAPGVLLRARPHDAPASGVAVDQRRPTRARSALR